MKNIHDLIEQIKVLEKRLSEEIQKKEEEFYYNIRGKKVEFAKATRAYHKELVKAVAPYLREAAIMNILTAPLIWFCLFPALFMDLCVSLFQAICFPVYKIPKVKRQEYIVIDRHALAYLNVIEKINCMYCGYFNGLIAYVQEIGARTEQYWCPIKHARKVGAIHSRYHTFFEYGDGKEFRENIEKVRRNFSEP